MKKTGLEILSMATASDASGSVQIEDFAVKGMRAKVRVKIVASADTSKQEIIGQLNAKFNGKLRAVPKSFKLTEQSSGNPKAVIVHAIGFVVPNVEVIEAATAAGRMTEVASNMFLDESDCIWNQTGGFMYKKSDVESAEALEALLAECSSEGQTVTRMKKREEFAVMAGVTSGDFVTFMGKGEVMAGFVVAADDLGKFMVIACTEDEPEIIEAFDIQERIKLDNDKINYPQEAEMSGAIDINALIAYYKRLYTYNPQYFVELERRIRSYSFM